MPIAPPSKVIARRSMETVDCGRLPVAHRIAKVVSSNEPPTSEGEALSLSSETFAFLERVASRGTDRVWPDHARASFVHDRASSSKPVEARTALDASLSRMTVAVTLHDASGNHSDVSVGLQRAADNR